MIPQQPYFLIPPNITTFALSNYAVNYKKERSVLIKCSEFITQK